MSNRRDSAATVGRVEVALQRPRRDTAAVAVGSRPREGRDLYPTYETPTYEAPTYETMNEFGNCVAQP